MPSAPQDHKPPTKKGGKKRKPPQSQDPDDRYSPSVWGSGNLGGLTDLQVPSGQWCLVRVPGIEGLMKQGVLNNVDSLTKIVQDKHISKNEEGGSKVDVKSLSQDTEALAEITHVVDRVVVHCVVKPEVKMTPNDKTRREDGVIYADMIDLVDKMHIFNFVVGGSRDLESFRSGFLESLGSVESGEGVQDSA